MREALPEGDFEIVSINQSQKTGTRKKPVEVASFAEGRGMEGDAHSGLIENRQVSLLAVEEIEEANLQLATTSTRQCPERPPRRDRARRHNQ